jgi:hypothetical protein
MDMDIGRHRKKEGDYESRTVVVVKEGIESLRRGRRGTNPTQKEQPYAIVTHTTTDNANEFVPE